MRKWFHGWWLIVGLLAAAAVAYTADTDMVNSLVFRTYNPFMNFAGTLTFMNRQGQTIATLTDKGVLSIVNVTSITGLPVQMPGIVIAPPTVTGVVPGIGFSSSDLVIARSTQLVAPNGPSIDGITLRVRLGTKFGTYKLVAVGGNMYGSEVTIADNIPSWGAPTLGP
jgi:hypothetical protein